MNESSMVTAVVIWPHVLMAWFLVERTMLRLPEVENDTTWISTVYRMHAITLFGVCLGLFKLFTRTDWTAWHLLAHEKSGMWLPPVLVVIFGFVAWFNWNSQADRWAWRFYILLGLGLAFYYALQGTV